MSGGRLIGLLMLLSGTVLIWSGWEDVNLRDTIRAWIRDGKLPDLGPKEPAP